MNIHRLDLGKPSCCGLQTQLPVLTDAEAAPQANLSTSPPKLLKTTRRGEVCGALQGLIDSEWSSYHSAYDVGHAACAPTPPKLCS